MTKLKRTVETESRKEIGDTAADFLLRRRFGRWNEVEQAELDAWLSESELRHVAFLRLEAGLARIERIAALRVPALKRSSRVARLRFMMPFLASALALGLLAFVGWVAAQFLLQPTDHTYSTEVGGRTLLSFNDHTQIELNTDTVMRYRMTTAERTVWLERGEAWFHVSHDSRHPFTVIVGKHRVTDLGTEFLVRGGSDRVEVALLNGRATLSTEGAQTAMLMPGDEATATPVSMTVTRKTPQQLADELAWRRGLLVFRNTRLADAVSEFNRYNETKLIIVDPAIADLKFSAEIKTENFEDFLHIAQAVLNLHVDREGNNILISRSSREETKKGRRNRRNQ